MRIARSRARGDQTFLWLACLVTLCAGYYIAFFRLGMAIDAQHDLAGQVGTIARTNDEILSSRPQLEQTERALNGQLRKLNIQADHATTVARFIGECARVTTAHHTSLVQIDERRGTEANSRGSQPLTEDAPFETIPLDVTLTGSYRDLIKSIRDLTQAPVALRIEIASIERNAGTDRDARTAPLTARLHVSVERLPSETPAVAAATPMSEEMLHARSY